VPRPWTPVTVSGNDNPQGLSPTRSKLAAFGSVPNAIIAVVDFEVPEAGFGPRVDLSLFNAYADVAYLTRFRFSSR